MNSNKLNRLLQLLVLVGLIVDLSHTYALAQSDLSRARHSAIQPIESDEPMHASTIDTASNAQSPVGSGDPIPGDTKPGASRGECNQYADLPPMRLIVPDSSETLTTQEAFPSFFVYLPFDLRSTDYGLFVLESESGRALYRQEFRSLQGGGILRIDLEEAEDLLRTGAGLSADTEYNWSFSVSCEGFIINVAQERGASVTRVSSSADVNPWYDIFDAAAAAYESGSSDAWSDLLQANGFEDISSDPFLPTD